MTLKMHASDWLVLVKFLSNSQLEHELRKYGDLRYRASTKNSASIIFSKSFKLKFWNRKLEKNDFFTLIALFANGGDIVSCFLKKKKNM